MDGLRPPDDRLRDSHHLTERLHDGFRERSTQPTGLSRQRDVRAARIGDILHRYRMIPPHDLNFAP